MIWTWLASTSTDLARYVILTATLHITGYVPQLEGGVAPTYALTPWVQVGATTGLSWTDTTPNPALNEIELIDMESEDFAGNVSSRVDE